MKLMGRMIVLAGLSLFVGVSVHAGQVEEISCLDVVAHLRGHLPYDRFIKRFDSLQEAVSNSKNMMELSEQLSSNKIRLAMLQLQGILRNYTVDESDDSGFRGFKKFLNEIRDLEGETADYMLAKEILAVAKSTAASQKLLDHLESNRVIAQKKFIDFLAQNGWAPGDRTKIDQWFKKLSKLNINEDEKEDMKILARNMAKYLKNSKKKLDLIAPIISLPQYNEQQLDDGLHHFRRVVRWVTNMLQTAEGIYQYREVSDIDKLSDLYLAYKDSVYAKLASPMEQPINLDFISVLVMTKIVTEAGLVKDFGEAHFHLSRALLEIGEAHSSAEADAMANTLIKAKWGDVHVEERTRELYQYYLEHDPISKVREDLQKQL